MILQELYNKYPGYQDENDDQSKPSLGDLRKTKLTLKQLNKLRRMDDIRKYEKELIKELGYTKEEIEDLGIIVCCISTINIVCKFFY